MRPCRAPTELQMTVEKPETTARPQELEARDRTVRKSTLLGGTAATVVVNLGTTGLNFLLTVTLSRLLGVEGYGAYAFAFAWATALSSAAVLGLSPLVVRNVAAYALAASWGLLKGVLRRANQVVLVSSALIVGPAAAAGWFLKRGEPELLHPYLIGLLLVPLIALASLRQAALQSLHRIVLGRLPEAIVAPSLVILVSAALAAVLDERFSATAAMAVHVGAVAVAFGAGAYLLRRELPLAVRSSTARYETRVWARSALPLFLATGVGALGAPLGTIMVGVLGGAAEAGTYAVATRVATFTAFLSLAASYPLLPMVARMHARGERDALQKLLVRSTVVVFLASLPLAMLLVLLAGPILGIFGSDFEGGVDALRILVLGEVLKLLVAFGGLTLLMTGNEGAMPRALVFGILLNLLLGVLLIPAFGVTGAAVASSTGLTLSAYLMAYFAWRRERLIPSIFAPRALTGR
jgi:O-antigen/teichoic acid export membrane protein